MIRGKATTRNVVRRKKKIPKGYDSLFEYNLHTAKLNACSFHAARFPYTVEHMYQPDFIYKDTLIEAKGRFRDSKEAAKYVWIRKGLPWTLELVFVFQNPNTPMPGARKRKDGTKFTHGEWADKHGFKHYTMDNVPNEWSNT